MQAIISIHEYELRPEVAPAAFEAAVQEAVSRRLFELPGLAAFHFLKGIKGARAEKFAAVWIYESREAWERLWGSPVAPKSREAYPPSWLIWEDDILAPLLVCEPDRIIFTSYEVMRVTAQPSGGE